VAHPERTCIGCRTRAPITELVRVVADTPGITLDERRRLPGRGAWVHPLPACIEAATRRKAWARALKSPGISVDAAALSSRVDRPGFPDAGHLALDLGADCPDGQETTRKWAHAHDHSMSTPQ
jgi:predicted RNA-binding protein YlxR (DUF448 family)